MLMKVHNKGQVVIPAEMRKELGISIGDHLDVRLDVEQKRIELRKPTEGTAEKLAGSLRQYGRGKPFPSREEVRKSLQRGLSRDV